MLRRIIWVLVTLLTVSLFWTPAAQAYKPKSGGLFNVPNPWGSYAANWRLMTHVEKAIHESRRGSTILISTYLLDRSRSVDRLVSACRRGVSVRVIMDADIDNRNSKRLIQTLNGDNVPDRDDNGEPDRKPRAGDCNSKLRNKAAPERELLTDAEAERSLRVATEDSITWGGDRSYAKKCAGACRGGGGNMHSKFFAFSKTGKARDVVMLSSANLNKGGALNGWNDLYTMVNRPKSYKKYNEIHREMTEDSRAGDGKVQVKDGRFISRFFPMRGASRANDPTMQDLRRIGCHSAYGRTKIRVSMFYWAKARGDYIADKLLGLARNGCRVSIIYGAPSIPIATRLRDAARRRLIGLYDSRWDHNRDGYNEVRTHAKYVLVKGRYGSDASSHQVWTGSQNWVSGSLSKGDEVTLNVAKKSAYNDYIDNWNVVKRHSRRLPYNR